MATSLGHPSERSPASEYADADSSRPPVVRRRHYRASILRGDFFVLWNLKSFLEGTLRQWIQPGMAVADVGCGEQPLRAVVEGLGGRYTGVDVVQNDQGTVDVVADISRVPLPANMFELVLCTEVLEHVPDPLAAVAELRRLCRPGGAIIITTPFAYPLHEEPHDFLRLTPHMLRWCAREVDLDLRELTLLGDELQVAATLWCNLWSRRRGRGKLRSAWNVLMRLPVNLLVLGLTPLQRLLPRKYFLNTCCLLLKPQE
jgi:SAM-dependent methyltransferase